MSSWSSLYTTVKGLLTRAAAGEPQVLYFLPLLAVLALVVVVFIVVMTNAERRITIQYAKRVVGRKQMVRATATLPLKLNMSGVMPIIFASSLVSIPGTIGSFLQIDQAAHPFLYAFFHTFNYTSWLYVVIYLLLILAFNYFYVGDCQYNPVEIANNLRRNNGSIPRFRSGKPTSDFITAHPEQDHPLRVHLPGCGGCTAHRPGQLDRNEHPARWYQPADRCRRGAGYDPQPGQLYDDAQPQRLFGLI